MDNKRQEEICEGYFSIMEKPEDDEQIVKCRYIWKLKRCSIGKNIK